MNETQTTRILESPVQKQPLESYLNKHGWLQWSKSSEGFLNPDWLQFTCQKYNAGPVSKWVFYLWQSRNISCWCVCVCVGSLSLLKYLRAIKTTLFSFPMFCYLGVISVNVWFPIKVSHFRHPMPKHDCTTYLTSDLLRRITTWLITEVRWAFDLMWQNESVKCLLNHNKSRWLMASIYSSSKDMAYMDEMYRLLLWCSRENSIDG